MRVLIAGELPLAENVLTLCAAAGHTADLYLVETLRDAHTAKKLAEAAPSADIAIECHNESKAGKRRVLELLGGAPSIYVCALAASATEAASWLPEPDRAVGWGALPPLAAGGLMEVTAPMQAPPESVLAAEAFWTGLGLECHRVADGTGLVRARIVCALVNEAATALSEGVASAKDIDTAMRLGANYPYGPLAWGDVIGLDVVLGVMRGLQDEFGEDRYRPSPLLARHVMAGRLGQKVGKGFYDY